MWVAHLRALSYIGTKQIFRRMPRRHCDLLNVFMLTAAILGFGLFVFVESRVPSPLIRMTLFRDRALSAGLTMSTLVSTVVMATLVVGPFYLARALGLQAALVGLVMSVGPLVAALTGVPAGRLADRFGTEGITLAGLIGIAAGAVSLSIIPASFGIAGYLGPFVVVTACYALFQTANNPAIMREVRADQRGVISGILNLSRNLGLITGASVMGAVFGFATATSDIATARPEAVATGMQTTFAVAAVLILIALVISMKSRAKPADTNSVYDPGALPIGR